MKSSFESIVFCFKGTQRRARAERERGRRTRKRGNPKRGGIFKGERIAIYAFKMPSADALMGVAGELLKACFDNFQIILESFHLRYCEKV